MARYVATTTPAKQDCKEGRVSRPLFTLFTDMAVGEVVGATLAVGGAVGRGVGGGMWFGSQFLKQQTESGGDQLRGWY